MGTTGQHRGRKGGGGREPLPRRQQHLRQTIPVWLSPVGLSEEGEVGLPLVQGPHGRGECAPALRDLVSSAPCSEHHRDRPPRSHHMVLHRLFFLLVSDSVLDKEGELNKRCHHNAVGDLWWLCPSSWLPSHPSMDVCAFFPTEMDASSLDKKRKNSLTIFSIFSPFSLMDSVQ